MSLAYTVSSKAASPNAIEQVLTGSADRPAIIATTALESTPPDRNAPSGTSATRRMRTASRRRSISSWVTSPVTGWGSSGKSQNWRGAGTGSPRRSVSVCPGGNLSAAL